MKWHHDEALLEPLLRRLRIGRILPILAHVPNCRLLDVGCGREARFLKEMEPYIASGVGIDPKAPILQGGGIRTMQMRLEESLPLEDETFDMVTMLAVLEHVEHMESILREILRVLRPGGIFCGTVPSVWAKPVLEFLAFHLNIVDSEEIRDHKRYFTKNSLYTLFCRIGFSDFKHNYFQFGMNNFFYACKPAQRKACNK